jgi:hypothetical protein
VMPMSGFHQVHQDERTNQSCCQREILDHLHSLLAQGHLGRKRNAEWVNVEDTEYGSSRLRFPTAKNGGIVPA